MRHSQETDPDDSDKPQHAACARAPRTLLLVDDEPNIVSALKRLLRRDHYRILTANSGPEGLELLDREKVDVILSDQRMPGMTGVEFLSKARQAHPDTVRLVLSGYTELKSVTDAVNEGAITKFLTKPWDDDQLREHVREAFQRKELANENARLNDELRKVNQQLGAANRKLETVLKQQRQEIACGEISLHVAHEILQHLPVPVLGIDEDGIIVFYNEAARTLLSPACMLGAPAEAAVPGLSSLTRDGEPGMITLAGVPRRINGHQMGQHSPSRGLLITLTTESPAP